jgi:hypothetical protein
MRVSACIPRACNERYCNFQFDLMESIENHIAKLPSTHTILAFCLYVCYSTANYWIYNVTKNYYACIRIETNEVLMHNFIYWKKYLFFVTDILDVQRIRRLIASKILRK